ncbi:hypothetical protein Naga_100897g2 [Nannochloropsis gaditana]|uniref:Uncharacterized protein n=1 Tax=Nannochloropsis gaditana TaxID=72520 RepID=W7TIZ4_9STRA|nr:hypothetical protein Naga_100897g2 [Nannochloropsis gaditana]
MLPISIELYRQPELQGFLEDMCLLRLEIKSISGRSDWKKGCAVYLIYTRTTLGHMSVVAPLTSFLWYLGF